MGVEGEVGDFLAIERRIDHKELADVGLVGVVAGRYLQVGRAYQHTSQDDHHDDNAHYAKGIGDGRT